jgi:hypothetical protein
MAGERTARVPYPEPVRDMGALRKSLVAMAAAARAGSAAEAAPGPDGPTCTRSAGTRRQQR